METPSGALTIREGVKTTVWDTGIARCHLLGPELRTVPPITGTTIGGALTVELGGYLYQPINTEGSDVSWFLTEDIPGVTIDHSTGQITVAEGFAVRSTDGSLGVYVVALTATGAVQSNTAPITIDVSTYDLPVITGGVFVADASRNDQYADMLPYLAAGTHAVPLTWSFENPPVKGLSIEATGGRLSARRGLNLTAAVTVVVTDRLGRTATRAVPIAIRSAALTRIVRLTRTTGSDFMNVADLTAYDGAVRRHPSTGGVVPLYTDQYGQYDWQNLDDGNGATFAATLNVANAHMYLDYGAEGVIVDRVRLVNRSFSVFAGLGQSAFDFTVPLVYP